MPVVPGDRLVVRGHRGGPDRDAEILEVHGPDGRPPYLVRWGDTGHVALFFPTAQDVVQHFPRPQLSTVGDGRKARTGS